VLPQSKQIEKNSETSTFPGNRKRVGMPYVIEFEKSPTTPHAPQKSSTMFSD